MRVAYQGERGAFSEAAAYRLLGGAIAAVPCRTFEEMFASVQGGESDCCVAPIENSLAGSIHRNYDLLLDSELAIAGETHLRIVHNLIAHPASSLDAIRRVYSHPVALAQCGKFLQSHPHLEPVPVHDTAGAVRMVMERGRTDESAIASVDAAKVHGGAVLAGGIEDNPKNYTRFLLVTARERTEPIPIHEQPRRWKTSVVFRVDNRPGALFRALGVFAMRDIDLSKIESRPVEGRPWEYSFYLDLIGRDTDPNVARALENLKEMAEMVRVMGSYATRW